MELSTIPQAKSASERLAEIRVREGKSASERLAELNNRVSKMQQAFPFQVYFCSLPSRSNSVFSMSARGRADTSENESPVRRRIRALEAQVEALQVTVQEKDLLIEELKTKLRRRDAEHAEMENAKASGALVRVEAAEQMRQAGDQQATAELALRKEEGGRNTTAELEALKLRYSELQAQVPSRDGPAEMVQPRWSSRDGPAEMYIRINIGDHIGGDAHGLCERWQGGADIMRRVERVQAPKTADSSELVKELSSALHAPHPHDSVGAML
eukprot:gene1946-2629_t